MARSLDSEHGASFARRDPLDNTREPRMGRLALVPLIAALLFAAVAWFGHVWVEQGRMRAVAAAVLAQGHAGPVEVAPMPGDECWRAREGFAWKAAAAEGWACAGPGGEVRLMDPVRRVPGEGR